MNESRQRSDSPATSARAIRVLIRLYPPAFRARYGRELEQVVRSSWRALEHATLARRLAFWVHVAVDLALGGAREHVLALRERRVRRRQDALARIHGSMDSPSTSGDGMGTIAQDIRYAWRTARKSPGFALVIIASLALGIGANSLIYSIVDGMVLRPFAYPNADRLVAIGVTYPALDGERQFLETISPPEYIDIRDGVKSLERVFAFDLGNRNLTGGDQPERVFTGFMWGDPMASIGVRPLLGRSFRPEETTTPGASIAVISHRVWQSRFGGDSAVIGRSIRVNGQPTEIIGVMPPNLLLLGTDLWLPMGVAPSEFPRQARQWAVVGRLRGGATMETANAELTALAGRIEQEFGRERKEYAGWRLEVDTWANAIVGEYRPAAIMLMGTVGLVLLIACANIASLLLAKATARQRELAVRRALGADRWRIVRQLLTESVLLAMIGGVVGLGLAYALLEPTAALFPSRISASGIDVSINGRVLLYTLGAALFSGLLFGVAPALQGLRGGSREALSGLGAAGRLTTSVSGRRLRSAFVVAEIALSLMLLVGAGVLLRSFARLQGVDPGIDTRNVLTMRISLPREQYKSEAVGVFFDEVTRRLATMPGVRSAGAATQFPPMNSFTTPIAIDGQVSAADQLPRIDITNTAGNYFASLGYKLKAGRLLEETDTEQSPPVAVINETAVRRFFGGENPIGRRMAFGEAKTPKWIEVVGVVADVRNRGLGAPPSPEAFVPVRQELSGWNNQLFLTIRTRSEPHALMSEVRKTIASLDPLQPVYQIRTLDEAFAEAVSQRRAAMLLISIFAMVALVLAAVGIYGVMSHMVNERTHEIGIRMALGAVGGDVLGLVMRQTARLVAIGAVLGIAGALALGRFLTSLVFEVRPGDPTTLVTVTVLLTLVAVAATLIPALRATRVMPIVALRRE
jgi:putative ABC transport system permease protein